MLLCITLSTTEIYWLPFFFFVKMHPVGFEPTHLSIAELKSAPLDHSGTNAFYSILLFLACFSLSVVFLFLLTLTETKNLWRWGVSIPLPLACEANALPSELHPLYSFCLSFRFSFASFFHSKKMHPVGFEPTHLSIAVLETAPLDHSGTNASLYYPFHCHPEMYYFFYLLLLFIF